MIPRDIQVTLTKWLVYSLVSAVPITALIWLLAWSHGMETRNLWEILLLVGETYILATSVVFAAFVLCAGASRLSR